MEPWHRVATPREEVREGRYFNPDEFAIHLEQVISKTAPEDYRNPQQFFSHTCFTRALRGHAGILLQAGGQANALRALIKAEQGRGPEFVSLANALSVLYPTGSEEKRLLDAMLLAVPR